MTPAAQTLAAADKDRMRDAAELLLAARRDVAPMNHLPAGLQPKTLAEAYALQDLVAEAIGPHGGWKVGAPGPEAEPLCAPMPIWGGYLASGEQFSDRYARLRGVEGEIAFLLGQNLPARSTPYSREEVAAAIASAHPAIEILESAFTDPDAVDRLSMIGDLQMNGGFVYGPALRDWQAVDLRGETVRVVVDSAVRCEAGMANPAGADLLRLVTWLANKGQARTGGLKQGDWVTTGSWTGKLYAVAGSLVQVTFGHFGAVDVSFA